MASEGQGYSSTVTPSPRSGPSHHNALFEREREGDGEGDRQRRSHRKGGQEVQKGRTRLRELGLPILFVVIFCLAFFLLPFVRRTFLTVSDPRKELFQKLFFSFAHLISSHLRRISVYDSVLECMYLSFLR